MDTTLLRILAIVLIANSHLEELYPFRPLAADGLIGNSMFFLLSGLGLALSPRTSEGRFVAWYRRRLGRIYPGLWIAVLLGTAGWEGGWHGRGIGQVLHDLFWPTPYGFVAQIVVFYPFFYLLKTARNRKWEWGILVGLGLAYLGVATFRYDLHALSWIYYFQMMILGSLLAVRLPEMGRHPRRDLGIVVVTLLLYVGLKLAMVSGRIPMHVGPLHAMTAVILIGLLGLNASSRPQSIALDPRLTRPLGLFASLTLEIYLVHGFVYEAPQVARLAFPLNLAVFWAATLPLAWALGRSAEALRGFPATLSKWRKDADSDRRESPPAIGLPGSIRDTASRTSRPASRGRRRRRASSALPSR